MKAFKGCINNECKSYQNRIHLKSDYEYCPYCSQKIVYVCADCWKVLPQNNHRLCSDCQQIHQQKKQQHIQQGKELVKGAVQIAPAVLQHKDKIINGGKKVVQVVSKAKK